MACFLPGITAEESPAEDSPTRHYRLKNSSFCLRLGNSSQFKNIVWTFNNEVIVLNQEVNSHKDTMEYNPSDTSLCINNVTETDSGTYKISFVNSQNKYSTKTHVLMVEGKFYIVIYL